MTHTMASACLYPRIAFYFDSYLLLLNKTPIAKKSYSTFKKGGINFRGFIYQHKVLMSCVLLAGMQTNVVRKEYNSYSQVGVTKTPVKSNHYYLFNIVF